jgi:hypothetical protein
MRPGRVPVCLALAALASAGTIADAQEPAASPQAQQPPATFRSRVTVVPVDIRVDGPIDDLKMAIGTPAMSGTADARLVDVDVRIQPGGVKLARNGQDYIGKVEPPTSSDRR